MSTPQREREALAAIHAAVDELWRESIPHGTTVQGYRRSVVRRLRAALGEFDAELYGAIGDGVADDSAAIQDAVDAAASAGGGTVRLPRRAYIKAKR